MGAVLWSRLSSTRGICGLCWPWWSPSHDRPSWFARAGREQAAPIWLAVEPTDMRCGFDRLAERVRAVIGQNPLSGHLFLFRSRRGDRLKILHWDQDGFILWYKRLEVGVFKLPRAGQGARSVELRASELAMVLDGIDVSKLKRVPRYARISDGNREKILV